ncbi:hypothetical protein FOZ62_018642, partial [Perkinsus olseni]
VFLPITHRPQHIVSSSTSSSTYAAAESSAQPPSTQQRIKTLFDEYVASGMTPNDALLAALAVVKKADDK